MTKATKGIKTSHPYVDSNIIQSVERDYFRKNAPMICNGKGELTVYDGKNWLPQWEFERVYPELPLIKTNWINYDRTKNWLHNKKSY